MEAIVVATFHWLQGTESLDVIDNLRVSLKTVCRDMIDVPTSESSQRRDSHAVGNGRLVFGGQPLTIISFQHVREVGQKTGELVLYPFLASPSPAFYLLPT